MATELTMPKNDMDMEEGTIVKWLKNVGDKVEKGEMFMKSRQTRLPWRSNLRQQEFSLLSSIRAEM